jgi:stage II sporulation protein D
MENDLKRLLFVPKEGNFWMYLNGLPYRGVLEVLRNEEGESLRALNLISLEDYLKGVVPAEIGKLTTDEMEALKAQAVAARTYSLSRLGQYEKEGYDLEATVADQVYKGIKGEDPLGNRAVELTQREILIYRGKPAQAYYHANSGGKTEDVNQVWGKPRETYLRSVDDDDFCSWSESYSWEESWTAETLRRNLEKYLRSTNALRSDYLGEVTDLRIVRRTPSGRVEVLEVVTDKQVYKITGDQIRWALRRGSNSGSILPSTRFSLRIQRDEDGSIRQINAQGSGNGHGVGMCQTGAIGMARSGYSYKDILTFYYPGVEIVKWN